MNFFALIEEWPDEVWVVFREPPGCCATAPTIAEALHKAPLAIAEYLRWLKQNNIYWFDEEVEQINVIVKEQLPAKQVAPLFEADRPAPTEQEIAQALQIAAAARAQLIECYNAVPPALRSRAPEPDAWSLTEHLQHILKAEAHYIECLNEQLPELEPAIDGQDLGAQFLERAQHYEAFLHALSTEQRAHVYVHEAAEWTMAKTLRRMIEHLREHYPWMQEIVRQLSQP